MANKEQVGFFWYLNSTFQMPNLPLVKDLEIKQIDDPSTIAKVTQEDIASVRQKIKLGNKSYVVFIKDEPAAFGWCSFKNATFGPQKHPVNVPEDNRYLWDFVTFPAWRGKGIYPSLLQFIIKSELKEAKHFWILCQYSNIASRKGIKKAGFLGIGNIYEDANKELFIEATNSKYEELVRKASGILNIRII